MKARKTLRAACAALSLAASAACLAQAYPSKPVRVVVPFPPGGVDVLARIITTEMSKSIGQPVVLENRAGANGIIGSEVVMRAPPDGYTLLITTSSTMISSLLLSKNVPFHPVRDFTPIANLYESQQVLVARAGAPFNTLQEMLEYAKKNPGKLTYASSGIGSSFHFSGESLKIGAGIDLLHVPYKGTGPQAVAIIAGEVDLAFPTMGNLGSNVNKVKILALNSAQRNSRLPGVPPIEELVPKFRRIPGWIALFGPAGMDSGVVNRVNAEAIAALKTQPVKEAFEQQFTNPLAGPPSELAATIKHDLELSQQLAKTIGIKPE